jgi:hypothetical protein
MWSRNGTLIRLLLTTAAGGRGKAMSMIFRELNDVIRKVMLAEVDYDVKVGSLYFSKRFNEDGRRFYEELLRSALANGDETMLATTLRAKGCFASQEPYERNGVTRYRSVSENAHETLAEGEFNRFYIRAVCVQAIANGSEQVVVYRAKDVLNPRLESEAKIGIIVNAEALLRDVRENVGIDTALGLPNGPNSGLSVYLS